MSQTGLPPCTQFNAASMNSPLTTIDWPYCNSARQLTSVILNTKDFSKWDQLKYRRRLETFGTDDGPGIPASPSNHRKY